MDYSGMLINTGFAGDGVGFGLWRMEAHQYTKIPFQLAAIGSGFSAFGPRVSEKTVGAGAIQPLILRKLSAGGSRL